MQYRWKYQENPRTLSEKTRQIWLHEMRQIWLQEMLQIWLQEMRQIWLQKMRQIWLQEMRQIWLQEMHQFRKKYIFTANHLAAVGSFVRMAAHMAASPPVNQKESAQSKRLGNIGGNSQNF